MYKVKYTKKNNQKASEFETKTLLYLLAMRPDSDEISIFFIDCLNDLTGSNDNCTILWDTQSKGVASLNPTKIGEALITLFENYISELEFIDSILLIPKLNEGYLVNEDDSQFGIKNFLDSKQKYLTSGLLKEYCKRKKIDQVPPDLHKKIEDFLNEIIFVTASEKEVYIREIIQFKDKESLSLKFYTSIFDEIRDKQSSLKNICIEEVDINHPIDLLQYNKHLKSQEVKLMVLNRFIGIGLFKPSYIPMSYIDEVKNLDSEDRKDKVQENNEKISRTFFYKNNKYFFWRLLENITRIINSYPKDDIKCIYDKVDKNLIAKNITLDEDSTLFFISLIKDGVKNES